MFDPHISLRCAFLQDNQSFEELVEKQQAVLREKHHWLWKKVEEQRQQLALTSENTVRKQKELANGMHMPIEGWHYTPKNALM